MPFGQYSPWQEAAGAADALGQTLTRNTLGLAQLRYQKQLHDQQMAMQMQEAVMQNAVRQAQIGHFNMSNKHLEAENSRLKAATDIDIAKLFEAQQLGLSMRGRYPQPDMMQGPTAANAGKLTLGDIIQHAVTGGALAGKGMDVMMPHNIPANASAINPMGDVIGQGPMVLPQNSVYQVPGGQPVLNPGRVGVPAGGMSFSQTGGPTFVNPNFRPSAGRGPTGNEILRALSSEYYDEFPPALKTNMSNMVSNPDFLKQSMGDFVVPGMQQPSFAPPSVPGGSYSKPGTRPDPKALAAEAAKAIIDGADEAAVRARYKELTGIDLE